MFLPIVCEVRLSFLSNLHILYVKAHTVAIVVYDHLAAGSTSLRHSHPIGLIPIIRSPLVWIPCQRDLSSHRSPHQWCMALSDLSDYSQHSCRRRRRRLMELWTMMWLSSRHWVKRALVEINLTLNASGGVSVSPARRESYWSLRRPPFWMWYEGIFYLYALPSVQLY